ncbi:MAG: tetratricopeptide repeat protein [bacterium]
MDLENQLNEILSFIQNLDFDKADKLCRDLLNNNQNNDILFYFMGIIHFQLKDFNFALENLAKAININPAPNYYFDIGEVYREAGHPKEAFNSYLQVIKLVNGSQDAYFRAGEMLFFLKQYEQAVQYFNEALKFNPYDNESFFNLALCFLNLQKSSEAKGYLEKAIEIYPHETNYYYNLAIANLKLGENEAAIKNLEIAIELNPNIPEPYSLLSGTFLHCGVYHQRAIELLEKANELAYIKWTEKNRDYPINKINNIKLGICYFYEDKFNEEEYIKFETYLQSQIFKNFEIVKDFNNNYTHFCFVEQGDLFNPNAFLALVNEIQKNNPDIIYTDEDLYDQDNKRKSPYFKPEFSPYLLLSHNYMNSLLCLKNSDNVQKLTLEKINQNKIYEFLLKETELTKKISRIPDILYHRHIINHDKIKQNSTNELILNKIKNNGWNAEIVDYKEKNINSIKFNHEKNSKVSIIIPFKDKVELLKDCIESIELKSSYKNYELLLVNNRSCENETLEYLASLKHKVINADFEFNYSKINNTAAKEATGEYLILLNNDTKVISEDWIESLIGLAALTDVGAVGAKLLYPNETIQHCGMVKTDSHFSHVNRLMPDNYSGYMNYSDLIKEYSFITGACLAISKEKYFEVGGMNEELSIINNDVELCMKLREKGYYNLYNPHSKLYHLESVSREGLFKDIESQNFSYLTEKVNDFFAKADPFYNPNLKDAYFNMRAK